MTFQFDSARRVAQICRSVNPGIITVLGGYHASLMYEEIGAGADSGLFDFIVRGDLPRGVRTYTGSFVSQRRQVST
jgi:radical SAM superfamily enzyme YgiQ (UPF0313 family)